MKITNIEVVPVQNDKRGPNKMVVHFNEGSPWTPTDEELGRVNQTKFICEEIKHPECSRAYVHYLMHLFTHPSGDAVEIYNNHHSKRAYEKRRAEKNSKQLELFPQLI